MRKQRDNQYLDLLFIAGCVFHSVVMKDFTGYNHVSAFEYFQRLVIICPSLCLLVILY